MKYTGAHTIHDCIRTIKAVADAQGRILFIEPEDKKRPRRKGNTARSKAEQNVHAYCTSERGRSQCRK